MQSMDDFRGIHAGSSIVVCGCGTSLTTLTEPRRVITIGVNDVGRHFDPDYLVVVNHRSQFKGDRFRYVEESRARAVFSQLDLRIPHANQVRFRLGKRGGTDFSNPAVLHFTRNSPYVAVCLAIHMGAKRIGLIGVDFTADHFFGPTGTHPLQRELPQIEEEYRRLHDACQRMDIELVNLSSTSRLTCLPRMTIEELTGAAPQRERGLRIVSYATTPVAGVPSVLSRCIGESTPHDGRCVWSSNRYGNGVAFRGDVEWTSDSVRAKELLEGADAVVVHNGKVDERHRAILNAKPVVTVAHNYAWNVDTSHVGRGFPGLVVAQYQATLAEFAGWTPVPNPIERGELVPAQKGALVTIAYTPSGRIERHPPNHRLYWHSKGYETTSRVLDALARRHPLRLEVIRQRQVTHAESLAMKRRAHIVIDECVTGSYHRNSLEGLAAGCVVVNGIGILRGVEERFRECAAGADDIPFVAARLETLEEVLESLIARGAEALAEDGRRNRAWMERHWDFASQWTRVWQPAIERAMEHARTLHRVTPAAPAPLHDVTIVVPCGGAERMRNVRAVVGALKLAGVERVILAESDDEPRARELAAAAGYEHLFVPFDGTFHKARVMNAGADAVATGTFIWLDADLLVTRSFLERAVAEQRARDLDCLVPWTSVRYLSEEDSAAVAAGTKEPQRCGAVATLWTRKCRGGVVLMRTEFVRRFGGVCEEFRGWGGEDDAFFHKAAVLGRAGVTQRHDQHIVHLYHPLSGGYGSSAAIRANPHYARNLALLREIQKLRTPVSFLARFPPRASAAQT